MSKINLILTSAIYLLVLVDAEKPVEFRFTNLVCNSMDRKYILFETCVLKAVSRNEQYISIHAKLLKKPVIDAKILYRFVKRANGWRPFLYSGKISCDYPPKSSRISRIIWNHYRKFTNMNHSCPYNEDVVLHKETNAEVPLKVLLGLPLPHGDYALFSDYILDYKHRASVRFFGTIF